ncbi:MAG: 50S ribosomal protein L25 [Candidatus Pacebacteria bacterium]|nr:50S ribosomal protein L25 [Candidatus Paceibacterota bacterium]
METLEIIAQTREQKGKKTNQLRSEGYVPGVVYGNKKENKHIKINNIDFKKVLSGAGESTLIDLSIDGKDIGKVIINDYQTDPVTDKIIHFDLYQVRMDKKIVAKVPINFIGESPAVKNEGGVLVKSHNIFEINCLPGDLIHDLEVDLSGLGHVDDIIRVKDLKISDKIEILSNPEVVVVTVAPPRTDKEIEDLEEKVKEDIEGVEGAKEESGEDKGSKDGEEDKKGESEKSEKKEEKK